MFDLEGQGENVMMRLRSTTHSTGKTKDQRQAHRRPPRTMVEWRRSGQVHWNTSAVCLSTLQVLPRFGFTFCVNPAECDSSESSKNLKKIKHFMCGRRLQDAAASLQQGVEQHSEMRMVGIVRHEMKLYSRNNRRLWCFKEAKVEAVRSK